MVHDEPHDDAGNSGDLSEWYNVARVIIALAGVAGMMLLLIGSMLA